jgi:15-cis-phytoene synthase
MKTNSSAIFKKGSKTYYYSSLFFPPDVRQDIFTLYAFVRVADDFVDRITPQAEKYFTFKKAYHQALDGLLVKDELAANFADLVKHKGIQLEWVEAFFRSMEMDLSGSVYPDLESLLTYMYGSAETVGLMMARIMDLPDKASHSAQMLGRAMQYVNFIRDIDEDRRLGRTYFPKNVLVRYQLNQLDYQSAKLQKENFSHFIRDQVSVYREWQSQAEAGYRYIPRRLRIPIKTAAEMYKWTARVIYEDPHIVYVKKIKPTRFQVLIRAMINTFTLN